MLILTPCLVLAKVEARAKAKYPSVPAAPANLTSLLLRYHLNRFSASARTFTTFSNVMSGPVAQQQSSSIAGRTPPAAVSTIVALCPPASFDSGTVRVAHFCVTPFQAYQELWKYCNQIISDFLLCGLAPLVKVY
jgi:hypothetical protein